MRPPAFLTHPWGAALAIGAAAQALFTWRLGTPSTVVFDETHYVPAARVLLDLSHAPNIEHPLLGKTLIALGIALFGDNAIGWRACSTLAATGVVTAAFAILQLLFGRLRTATFGAIFVALNFTTYVQARVAMLDGFMAAFLLWGIALFLWARARGGWWRWIATAAAFGLAAGCKWAALPYAAVAGIAFCWIKARAPDRFGGVGWLSGGVGYGAVFAATYAATFAPAFFYATDPLTWDRLLPFQLEMYARQTQVLPTHTYQSAWWTWPLDLRPVWYLYERTDGAMRGILLLGNPVLMWGGVIAAAACLWGWRRSGDARLAGLVAVWIGSFAIYAIIPKSLGFYYYYYPSSVLLCLVLAAAFDHWRDRLRYWDERMAGAALVAFVYFFPILSAQALARDDAFRRWTWFASWI